MNIQRYKVYAWLLKCSKRSTTYQIPKKSNYSTEALATSSSPYISYTLCTNEVTNQTPDDIMKIHKLPKKDINSVLASTIPRRFQRLSEVIREHSILIRKPTFDILQHVENGGAPPKRIILSGPDGSGKSLTLMQIVYYCLLKDWMVLHVPKADMFAESKKRIDDTQQSLWNDQRADQPVESIKWLNQFRNMNTKLLTETKTQNHYKWGKREETDKGSPLMAVVEQGISRNIYASDAVGVVLKEIRLNKNLKVLYAVDGFNGFYGKTLLTLNDKLIETPNLSLVHHFTKLLKENYSLSNGLYLMALSQSINNKKSITYHPTAENLLPEEAFEDIGPHEEVWVPDYSEQEYQVMMQYYKDRFWLTRDLDENVIKQIRFMTNRNPECVRDICSEL